MASELAFITNDRDKLLKKRIIKLVKKSVEQWLHVVCVWENNKAAILNSGFQKDCTADNNWFYWKESNCPDVLELEYKLEKAFKFEQMAIKKTPLKKKEIKT